MEDVMEEIYTKNNDNLNLFICAKRTLDALVDYK